jgi:selenocysteine-specific elongation factor
VFGREIEAQRVKTVLEEAGFSPPTGQELLDASGVDPALLDAMVREEMIVRVADGLYFGRAAFEAMQEAVVELLRVRGKVTVAEARDALHTSRKYALAVLEYLDAQRVTRRQGDVRVLGNRA